MENVIIVLLSLVSSLICVAFIYWIDRYEKEPVLALILVFTWGALVAAPLSQFAINGVSSTFVTGDASTQSVVLAPIFEEAFKGLSLLIVFVFFQREFNSILDGMVYAGVGALGFAFSENLLFLHSNLQLFGTDVFGQLAFSRLVLSIWNHPAYTSLLGIGVGFALISPIRALKVLAPIIGFIAAVFVHALHNSLIVMAKASEGPWGILGFDWFGWAFIFAIVVLILKRERAWINDFLEDEVEAGILTQAQYLTACSLRHRAAAKITAVRNNTQSETEQFYELCSELAFAKRQRFMLESDLRNSEKLINTLRAELVNLQGSASVSPDL